jgi:hypothetical protein
MQETERLPSVLVDYDGNGEPDRETDLYWYVSEKVEHLKRYNTITGEWVPNDLEDLSKRFVCDGPTMKVRYVHISVLDGFPSYCKVTHTLPEGAPFFSDLLVLENIWAFYNRPLNEGELQIVRNWMGRRDAKQQFELSKFGEEMQELLIKDYEQPGSVTSRLWMMLRGRELLDSFGVRDIVDGNVKWDLYLDPRLPSEASGDVDHRDWRVPADATQG